MSGGVYGRIRDIILIEREILAQDIDFNNFKI